MDKIISTPSKRATLGMVAEKAGVSPSTVSRILNGTAQVVRKKKHWSRQSSKSLAFDLIQRPEVLRVGEP
jgi:hypothetical protein